MKNRRWTRDELLVIINFYCKIPFGKLHSRNPDIISLAKQLNRSPNAVAMKLVNFASLDPIQQKRGIKGLRNVSKVDIDVWQEFYSNWEQLAYESQLASLELQEQSEPDGVPAIPEEKETEKKRVVRIRLVQKFFRDVTLANYEFKCAFCGIELTPLLIASHIIPWKDDVKRRADPRNGICLCALHDKAFDTGILGLGDDLRILVSPTIKKHDVSELHRIGLLEIEGKPIATPRRFHPDPFALRYHRSHIFVP